MRLRVARVVVVVVVVLVIVVAALDDEVDDPRAMPGRRDLPDDAPVRADDDETAVGVVAEPGVVEDALCDVEPFSGDIRDAGMIVVYDPD